MLCILHIYRLIKKLLQQLFTDNILLQAMNYVTKPVSFYFYACIVLYIIITYVHMHTNMSIDQDSW